MPYRPPSPHTSGHRHSRFYLGSLDALRVPGGAQGEISKNHRIPKSSDLRCVYLKSPDRNRPFPAISKHDTGLMMPHLKSKRSLVLNNGNIPHITFVSSWCGSSIRTRMHQDFPPFCLQRKVQCTSSHQVKCITVVLLGSCWHFSVNIRPLHDVFCVGRRVTSRPDQTVSEVSEIPRF